MKKIAVLLALAACEPSKEEEQAFVAEVETKAANHVALDAMRQFEIVFKRGDKMEICVHAGFVAAAMLQLKDEKKYNDWKDVERKACKRAGVR